MAHVSMPHSLLLRFPDVEERGRQAIEEIRPQLAQMVGRSVTEPVYWHPTGFIVIPLKDIDGLGLVRLHVWPKRARKKRPRNPEVHAHCFHLQSFVLTGEYVEHQYAALPAEPRESPLQGFSVVPPSGDGVDRLRPDHRHYYLKVTRTERTPAGYFHSLPAGVHHKTDVPEESFCATLALLSRPQPGLVDHLIGPDAATQAPSIRTRVDGEVLDKALAMLGLV